MFVSFIARVALFLVLLNLLFDSFSLIDLLDKVLGGPVLSQQEEKKRRVEEERARVESERKAIEERERVEREKEEKKIRDAEEKARVEREKEEALKGPQRCGQCEEDFTAKDNHRGACKYHGGQVWS